LRSRCFAPRIEGERISVTDAQGNTTSFTYDARGNRTSSTDALGNVTTYTYDVMNRLTSIVQPGGATTSFAYDTRGRRTSVTDANGQTTAYQYDDADRLVAVTDANGSVTSYQYDTENHLAAITDALGRVTSFGYDSLGRVTGVTFPSSLSESYTYDAMGNRTAKTFLRQADPEPVPAGDHGVECDVVLPGRWTRLDHDLDQCRRKRGQWLRVRFLRQADQRERGGHQHLSSHRPRRRRPDRPLLLPRPLLRPLRRTVSQGRSIAIWHRTEFLRLRRKPPEGLFRLFRFMETEGALPRVS
jgi:YD repeat-containing protein